MTSTERLRRRPGVLWRRSLTAVVLLAPDSTEVVTLAETGPVVWDLLAEWRSREDLVESLARRYDADPAVVASDLEPVLTDLERLGALEVAADSGHAEQG